MTASPPGTRLAHPAFLAAFDDNTTLQHVIVEDGGRTITVKYMYQTVIGGPLASLFVKFPGEEIKGFEVQDGRLPINPITNKVTRAGVAYNDFKFSEEELAQGLDKLIYWIVKKRAEGN